MGLFEDIGLHIVIDHEGGQDVFLRGIDRLQGLVDVLDHLFHIKGNIGQLIIRREFERGGGFKPSLKFIQFLIHTFSLISAYRVLL